MDNLQKYLHELHFFEEMKVVTEDISNLLKGSNLKKIKDEMIDAAEVDDVQKLQRIARIIPKISEDTLYKLGVKAHPKFEETYKDAEKEVSKQLSLTGTKEKTVMSSIVAALSCVSDNPKDKVKKIVGAIKIKRDAKNKQFGGLGVGLLGLVIAGAFLASAFATLSMFPLLLSLVIVGIAIMVMIGAVSE